MEAEDIREKAYHVCVDYLGGIWKTLKPNDIHIERLHGGFINYLFKLTLPSDSKTRSDQPSQVLMKNFRDGFKTGQFGFMIENIIAILLAKEKLAPTVYGIFDSGRLDEFIEGRTLTASDFQNQNTLEVIITKIAHLHCLKLPINKNPLSCAFKKVEDDLKNNINSPKDHLKNDPIWQKLYQRFVDLEMQKESLWLDEIRNSVNSAVVFSHNDIYVNNMLFQNSNDASQNDIRFIDFELSGYYYRGHDLNRLFNCFIYEIGQEPPFFKINYGNFPEEEKKRWIIKIYLNEIQKRTNFNLDMDEEIEKLLKEIWVFELLNEYFIILVTLFRSFATTSTFDLTGISSNFMDNYFSKKAKFLEIYKD